MLALFGLLWSITISASKTALLTKRRRGKSLGLIMQLVNCIKEIEGHPDRPDSTVNAIQYESKLNLLDEEFRSVHYLILLYIDNKGEL